VAENHLIRIVKIMGAEMSAVHQESKIGKRAKYKLKLCFPQSKFSKTLELKCSV